MKMSEHNNLETSNFMQNIAECRNIAILGGKRLIPYSKLGLIAYFKVRVKKFLVLKNFKVKKMFKKLGLSKS